jgi:hypothetical protein
VGVVALAVAAPLALAGHLNRLLTADLDGRQEVNTTDSRALVGDPDLAPGNGRAAHIHQGKAGANGAGGAIRGQLREAQF